MSEPTLPMDNDLQRFGGIARLYGNSALELFKRSQLAVIGVGGVGSWAAEALVRSGVGTIRLIDLDEVCLSNVNRQLHALDGSYGKLKVTVMTERLQAISPNCRIEPITQFIRPDNTETLLADCNAVVDAIDSVNAKTHLIAHCKRAKLPIVVCGAAGGQRDPSQIQYRDLSQSWHDPLLAKVRSKLRKEYGFSSNPKRRFGIDCIFSNEQARYFTAEQAGGRLDCSGGFGASMMVTASFGLAASARVLERLLALQQRNVSDLNEQGSQLGEQGKSIGS